MMQPDPPKMKDWDVKQLKYLSSFDWAVHRFSDELAMWETESRKVTTQVRRLEYRNLAFRPRRHLSLKVYAVCPKEVDETGRQQGSGPLSSYTSLPASFSATWPTRPGIERI